MAGTEALLSFQVPRVSTDVRLVFRPMWATQPMQPLLDPKASRAVTWGLGAREGAQGKREVGWSVKSLCEQLASRALRVSGQV